MTDLKKLLLAGTAIVAIGGVSVPAFAATQTVAGDAQWSSSATHTGADITEADAGDDVNFTADATLTIQNDATPASDGGGADDFTLGDVTDASGVTGNIAVTTGAAGDLTVTINSVAIDGDFTITGVEALDSDIAVTLTEASTIGGDLTLTTDETDAAGTFDLTAEGGLTVTGATTVTASANGTSTLTTNGASTFTGGVDLDDDTGLATLAATVLGANDGTGFTVAGAIDGATAGEGTLTIDDADDTVLDAVTFSGVIGGNEALLAVDVGTAGANSGSAIFNGNVSAGTVTVGLAANETGAVADFNGNVTGTTLVVVASTAAVVETAVTIAGDLDAAVTITDVAGDGTAHLTLDGDTAQTVTGVITPTNREGLVTVSGSDVTFEANVGAAGNGLGLFAVSEGGKATLEGDLFTDSTNNTAAAGLDVDGTLVLDSTGASVEVLEDAGDIDFDGTLTLTGANDVDLEATAGDIYIDGIFSTALSGVSALTHLTSNTATVVGGTSDTSVTVGNHIIVDGGALTFGAGAGKTTTVLVSKSDEFTQAEIEAGAIDANNVVVSVNDDDVVKFGVASAEYDPGDTVLFVTGANAGSDLDGELDAGQIVLLNNGLLKLTSTANTSDTELEAVVSFRDAANVFSKKTYAGAANALLGMTSASTTGELQTIRSTLSASATSASASEEVAESISPTVDGGATSVAMTNVSNSANGLTGQRLASLRDGTSETGMAAGNLTHGLKMWAQVFGSTGEQDERDGISGYDVDSYGVTVGIDTQTLAEDWVWGLAFTYADTEVDSNNVNSTNTEIDTYQIALYADYKWDAQTYVNGIVGYGFNDADQTRHNVGTIAGLTANSDFDTDQFFAKLETGRDYELNNGTTLTPFALANFSYLDTEGYTETGAGTANLTVDTDDQYIFELGLGLEASWLHALEDGSYLKPSLVAGYRYDLADDEVEATSTFTGGGVAFKTEGFDPQNHTFNVGGGLTFYTTANWELSADYNYELKEDYDSHNGYVRAAYRF